MGRTIEILVVILEDQTTRKIFTAEFREENRKRPEKRNIFKKPQPSSWSRGDEVSIYKGGKR